MDAKYLAEIKARCDKATPGPWYEEGWALPTEDGDFVELTNDSPTDAAFIAHARTDIPALVAEVEDQTARANICEHDAKAFREDRDKLYSENAKLKKALELACDSKFRYMPCPDYFIRKAQEQEGKK